MSSYIALLFHSVVLEAVAVLCAVVGKVDIFWHIYHFKAVLVFSPERVLSELLVSFRTDAYFKLCGVAACEDVIAAYYEVFRTEMDISLCIVAIHNQIQCLMACTSFESLVWD